MSRLRLQFLALVFGIVFAVPHTVKALTIVPSSPTTSWTVIDYLGAPDWPDDQGTGITEADLVGDGSNPVAYTIFDNGGTADLTDGYIGFRVRIGTEKSPDGFSQVAMIGINVGSDMFSLDGALDLFLVVDNAGQNEISILDPGNDLNISPATTSVSSTGVSYTENITNYAWDPVNAIIDPDAMLNPLNGLYDVDDDDNGDMFLSFVVPFDAILAQLDPDGSLGYNEHSAFQYVIGTSSQANSFNQDISGPDKSDLKSAQDWSAIGANSVPLSASGFVMNPEPNSGLLVGLGLLLLSGFRSSKRRARA
jgi:hypothetical protein